MIVVGRSGNEAGLMIVVGRPADDGTMPPLTLCPPGGGAEGGCLVMPTTPEY
jgi:hypothetical protein